MHWVQDRLPYNSELAEQEHQREYNKWFLTCDREGKWELLGFHRPFTPKNAVGYFLRDGDVLPIEVTAWASIPEPKTFAKPKVGYMAVPYAFEGCDKDALDSREEFFCEVLHVDKKKQLATLKGMQAQWPFHALRPAVCTAKEIEESVVVGIMLQDQLPEPN